MTEVETACLERDRQACLVDLGVRLAAAKQLPPSSRLQLLPAQVMVASVCRWPVWAGDAA
jgi:hypothetical protein